MPTTTPILATRFNNLQSRIAAIYGPPSSASSATGYGQTVRSGQVESFDATSRTFNASTNVNYSNNQITISGHNFDEGGLAEYDANGNDPIVENLIEDAHYYVKVINANVVGKVMHNINVMI